jgi:hypothetical protein
MYQYQWTGINGYLVIVADTDKKQHKTTGTLLEQQGANVYFFPNSIYFEDKNALENSFKYIGL